MSATEAGGRVLIRMPRSLHRDLQEQARTEGVSLNQFIVSSLARVAGGARPAEPAALAGEEAYTLRDRLEVVEHKADGLDERITELEDWCPDLDERLDDLEDEWAIAQEGLGTALVKGLAQGVGETQYEGRQRMNRKQRIRARIDQRPSKDRPRG